MMDEQNRFISDASHELKTPLTSLKSAFEVFLRNKKKSLKEANTLIRESIDEVDNLQSLSESMLALAQYQKPNGNDLFEKLSLKQIILDSVKKIEPLANKKDIILKTNLVDTEIKGNKFSLIDLFVIILDNSIKYSSPKSKISITAYKKDSAIVVSVKDQGIGISAKDLPHIFDRFYRSDSARSHDKTKGYGLGLSIAQKIVKLHKGSIIAESIPKKGTTITIRLPKSL